MNDKITEIKEALVGTTPHPWRSYEKEYLKDKNGDPYITIESRRGYYDSLDGLGFQIDGILSHKDANIMANSPEYITYLLQLVEPLIEALESYGSERKYEEYFVPGIEEWSPPDILSDRGQKAREALSHIERMNKA